MSLHHAIAMEYEERKKKWYLDVRHTPCARSALLYGILGGGTVGLLYFFRSSVVRRSCDFAVGGFAVISLASWELCRMAKAKQRADTKRAVKVLNTMGNHNRPESTEQEDGR